MARRKDCRGDGCGECRVCRYLDFLEWASQAGGGVPHTVERDPELDAYIEFTYGVRP